MIDIKNESYKGITSLPLNDNNHYEISLNYPINSNFEDIENYLIDQNLSYSQVSSQQSSHLASRCACFFCQGNKNNNSAFVDNRISENSSTTNFFGKNSAEIEALTLDSLASIDSPYIDGTFVNAKWGSIDPDSGTTTELTYYITPSGYALSDGRTSVASDLFEEQAVSEANSAFTDVANISFTEVNSDEYADANFRWAFTTGPWLGVADFPGLYGDVTSDVIIYNNQYTSNIDLSVGGYYYITFTHELGHALGLAHPHNGGGAWDFNPYNGEFGSELYPGVTSTTSGGDNYLNSTPYTVMTYNDSTSSLTTTNTLGNTEYVTPRNTVDYGYNENLGVFDIATLQYLYGPNTTKSIGDDIYDLIPDTQNGYFTIWDNGGTDEINAEPSENAVTIDLRNATLLNEDGGGGYISKADGSHSGFVIAYNTTGTAIIENATGSEYNDIIVGNSSANILNGFSGDDTMSGGDGDDIYVVDSTSDTVTENSSEGTDLIQSYVTYTASSNVENLTLIGFGTNINATGNSLDNILTGNNGDNTLDGDSGDDAMSGGDGDDIYVVDSTSDTVTESSSEGTDTIQASVTYTASSNVENLTLTGSGDINASGNSLDNILTGNSGDNTLDGDSGDDAMSGGDGDDIYVVDSTSDTVTESSSEGTDTIQASVTYTASSNVENLTLTGSGNIDGTGNSLDNTLTGNSGDNTLDGDSGDDTLDGGSGDDSMSGGTGDDIYVVDSASDTITENFSEGTDTIQASVSYTASSNVENLTLTGSGDINATGNSLDNTLTGNSGDNILDGDSGDDSMSGGTGDDIYVVDSASDTVTENSSEGTDTIQSSVTYTSSSNVENLTLTGSGDIDGTGNSLDNTLTGNSGDNTLDGDSGDDSMSGGTGDDIYVVDSTSDTVTENDSEGTDLIQSSVSYTAASNVENLTLTGSGDINFNW